MKTGRILWVVLCLVMAQYGAQLSAQTRTCHTMGNLDRLLQSHPQMQEQMDQIEDFTRDFVNTPQLRGEQTVTIPVVVNVVYKTSAQNISDAQIMSQIEVLNEDFRRLNADADNTWSDATDPNIEFCLASVDPDGNPTTGIRRKQTNKPSFSANDQVKTNGQGLAPWDAGSYLNIWVCNLGSGLLGYAQFPGGPAETDGVVIDYAYFGTEGTASAPFDLGRTATHEVGHYLNLRHIWGDGPCSADDFVSDTPSSDGPNYGCALGHVSCGSVDMVQNYMDYSDDACMNLFTVGQSLRMDALFAPGGARASLLTSGGCGNVVEPTCEDGVQNGDETGVDCGGSNCPACPATCDDGIQNGDETGVDCGGSNCTPCETSTCSDGIQNGDETGVDCGGSNCPACPATCDDGIQNGDETGVDCGGSNCAPCNVSTCDVPGGTVATSIKRKRATLNWNAVDGALDYSIRFRVAGQTVWSSEATTTSTSITASSLSNNTTYEWEVRANCSGSSSDYSATCSFTAGDANSSSCAGERLAISSVLAFPNPTTGQLSIRIEMEAGNGYEVSLMDGTGRVVYYENVGSANLVSLDLGGLPVGLYFVQVSNGMDVQMTRVIKE
ncbi:MAG: M43 family zinc metalloprotease [Bacteroidetes bacterium]|nr:M43 family zinc metalloprotease [Bacteroidota bacterium]